MSRNILFPFRVVWCDFVVIDFMKKHFLSFLLLLLFAVCVSAQTDEVRQIDEFGRIYCDDYLARMDNAIITAKENPSSTVYILIYEGKEMRYNNRTKKDELMLPIFGSAKAKIDSIKKYLARRKFPLEQFSFIEAGFREESAVEIWLVPKGAVPPKSTPELKEMKYRKGKAVGFCTWCC